MGWALAIPDGWVGIPQYHYPGYTPPVLPTATRALRYRTHRPQRLAHSVKTAYSGSPIYHWAEKRVSECVGERQQGVVDPQNVPTFLIDT